MIKEGNVRVVYTISSNLNDAIRAYCNQNGGRVSDLIEDLITEFLNEVNGKGDFDANSD